MRFLKSQKMGWLQSVASATAHGLSAICMKLGIHTDDITASMHMLIFWSECEGQGHTRQLGKNTHFYYNTLYF